MVSCIFSLTLSDPILKTAQHRHLHEQILSIIKNKNLCRPTLAVPQWRAPSVPGWLSAAGAACGWRVAGEARPAQTDLPMCRQRRLSGHRAHAASAVASPLAVDLATKMEGM